MLHRTELVPDAPGGALWECDGCGALWMVRRIPFMGPDTPRGAQIAGYRPTWNKLSSLEAWWERRKFNSNKTGG